MLASSLHEAPYVYATDSQQWKWKFQYPVATCHVHPELWLNLNVQI